MEAAKEWKQLAKGSDLKGVQKAFFEANQPEALYNLADDPYELNNLIDEPSLQGKASELREKMMNLQKVYQIVALCLSPW